MKLTEYNNKTEEINTIIEKLCQVQSEKDCESICLKLEEIYCGQEEYRHEYSSILGKILELNNSCNSEDCQFNLQIIAQNINLIFQYACDKEDFTFMKQLVKLKDHINLEVSRITYTNQIKQDLMDAKILLGQEISTLKESAHQLTSQISSSKLMLKELDFKRKEIDEQLEVEKNTLETLKQEHKQTLELVDKTKKKVENSQKEYITILGVFSAVVLTFTGGIVFGSSVFENIHKPGIYRLILVCILIGFVLINTIYILIQLILWISLTEKEKIKVPQYIVILNIALMILAILTLIAWVFDIPYMVQTLQNKFFHQWFK